eukprot:TRINITY_DN3157_c0_g1_i10.p1 TRINITY_DN3157_c0_g1~~TRINITY_DN3157_c0_g1_i10.p1  ORF type:complete len:782 (+),score=75.37 TRINITY_DN3157_c0_g1_i10:59-2404(+)
MCFFACGMLQAALYFSGLVARASSDVSHDVFLAAPVQKIDSPRRSVFGHGRALLESDAQVDFNDLKYCTWNRAAKTCTADTVELLGSANSTSVPVFVVESVTSMLECSTYSMNSTACSTNPFCEEDMNGTCRTSSGPRTLRFINQAAQSILKSCGWLGASYATFPCQSYSLTECAAAGCAILGQELSLNSSGACQKGPACGDSIVAYMMRLCKDDPNWNVAAVASCFGIPDYEQVVNCTRPFCPQLAIRIEFDMLNRCSPLTLRDACLSDDRCWMSLHGICEEDGFNKIMHYAPIGCPLAKGAAWAYQCSQAGTPEKCAIYGHECLWEVEEVCVSEGLTTSRGHCRGRPEMLGVYLRREGNVTPLEDVLSKAVFSAHYCPRLTKDQCAPVDVDQEGGTAFPNELVIALAATVLSSFFVCVLVSVCLYRRRIATRGNEERGEKDDTIDSNVHASGEQDKDDVLEGAMSDDVLKSVQMTFFSNTEDLFASKDLLQLIAKGVDEHWAIAPHSLQLDPAIIGRGGFGEVMRGTLFDTTPVVVKQPHEDVSDELSTSLLNEIRLLRRLRHPNVVLFHGVTMLQRPGAQDSRLCLILEWASGGDLHHFLRAERNLLPHADILKLMQDVIRGIAYLHAQKPAILHRDVKPANILIEKHQPPLAKLADFGLSLLETGRKKGRAGTRVFMAPEVANKMDYGLPADIYSVGCVMLFVDKGGKPSVEEAELEWSLPGDLLTLARECMADDPHARPLAKDAFSRLSTLVEQGSSFMVSTNASGSSSTKGAAAL